jgi:hypothetical protein
MALQNGQERRSADGRGISAERRDGVSDFAQVEPCLSKFDPGVEISNTLASTRCVHLLWLLVLPRIMLLLLVHQEPYDFQTCWSAVNAGLG